MEDKKLTVIIPTLNEEKNIKDCIESVLWADEIIVADSLSTDRTVEIAKEYKVKIIQKECKYMAEHKNWAMDFASNDWILFIDADERVTQELKNEIIKVLKENKKCNGFWIYRRSYFLGKKVNYCGWQYDKVLRLFKKKEGKFKDKFVHEKLEINPPTGYLKNKLIHYTFTNLNNYLIKSINYAKLSALEKAKNRKKAKWFYFVFYPPFKFLKQYFIYQGFRDGIAGLLLCLLSAFNVFLKY